MTAGRMADRPTNANPLNDRTFSHAITPANYRFGRSLTVLPAAARAERELVLTQDVLGQRDAFNCFRSFPFLSLFRAPSIDYVREIVLYFFLSAVAHVGSPASHEIAAGESICLIKAHGEPNRRQCFAGLWPPPRENQTGNRCAEITLENASNYERRI